MSYVMRVARVGLGCAMGFACMAAWMPSAQAQFVCGGSPTGAEPQTGAGAVAAPGINVACGPSANASGGFSNNTAFGRNANASGAGGENTAFGGNADASGSGAAGRGNTAVGSRANASGDNSTNI